MLRRSFLACSSSLVVPEGVLAQSFNVKRAAEDLADALCLRDGAEWKATVEADFILIFRKA